MATEAKIIGGFRILQELQAGSGSQGTVYKAVCETAREGIAAVGDVVAIKVMAVQDEGQALWKKLEHRTQELVQLQHPNVVRYKGCFVEAGAFADIHVVVQEFLDGETLKDCLAKNPNGLDVDRGLEIVKATLEGLIYISGFGLVHRDLKPGNIFLCNDGSVKLIDFEIARREGGAATTAAGNIRGSFDYMAPDFINATFHGDVQSDIFSMGVVLHEVLTGNTPYQRFEGDRKQANFAFLSRWSNASQEGDNPIRISSRVKKLLANAEEVLEKALTPDRAVRYADFSAFRDALKTIRFRDLRNGANTYRLVQYIGKGGFGEVFKAKFRQTGESVAVKHLLKAEYAERFFREAKIMQKLQRMQDSCFVRFLDFFVSDQAGGRDAFIVMSFLDGMPGNSLRDAIRTAAANRKSLRKLDVLLAFRRYAYGLQAMHVHGIFHRDIKPSNLYYPSGHPERAAIMDLGIARDVNGTATTGQVPGTLDYMPPEVVVSDSRGDGGMDIYALGLCLYEALTGRMGYPRLPSGTEGYTAFFARARQNLPPTFDAPPVSEDKRLLKLLNSMTCPDAAKRLNDISKVIEALDPMIKSAGGTVEQQDLMVAPDDDAPTETLILDEFTGTNIGDFTGTSETSPLEENLQEAVENERVHLKRKRMAKVGGVLFLSALVVGGGIALWLTSKKDHAPSKPVGQLLSGSDKTNGLEAVGSRGFKVYVPTNVTARVGMSGDLKSTSWHSEHLGTNKLTAPVTPSKPPIASSSSDEKAEQAKKELAEAEQIRKEEAAKAAAELKRIQEETDRLKAEAERLRKAAEDEKKRAEEERLRREREQIANISNETARIEARKRLEREQAAARAKAKKEQAERDARNRELRAQARTDSTNRFWTLVEQMEPVASRKARLVDAEAIYRAVVTSNLLETSESGRLFDELVARRGWIVGRISNGCPDPIEVAGRSIAPSSSKLFVLTNGLPMRWEARRAGFENLQLSRQFDGQEIALADNSFVMSAVPVAIPVLPDGIVCLVDGEEKSGVVKRKPGETISYAFRRRGYSYGGATSYAVTDAKDQQLPKPADSDWKLDPVEVLVPRLMAGVSCWIDGGELTGGGVVTNLPGSKIVCTYRRKGYKDVRKTYEVIFAEYQELPAPTFQEWELLPVIVAIPELPSGVTCWIGDKQATGTLSRKPGDQIAVTYRRDGYDDIQKAYEVSIEPEQNLPVPAAGEWRSLRVTVQMPQLPADATCQIDGVAVSGRETTLSPGRHVCTYNRPDYQPQKIEFQVQGDGPATVPAPQDWVATEGLVSLDAAEAAAKKGAWKEVEKLLRGADVHGAANVARKEKFKTQIDNQLRLSKLAEQAEMYYSDESWKHVIRCFAEARGMGYMLSEDESGMVEEAYANERARIKTIRDRVVREMSIGKSPSYDLAKLDAEENQLHEWYNVIKK